MVENDRAVYSEKQVKQNGHHTKQKTVTTQTFLQHTTKHKTVMATVTVTLIKGCMHRAPCTCSTLHNCINWENDRAVYSERE